MAKKAKKAKKAKSMNAAVLGWHLKTFEAGMLNS